MDFSFSTTELLTLDESVVSPQGLIYSTAPKKAEGGNGRSYFVKGEVQEVIFAELSGCLLANAISLPVPAVALCTFGGEYFAGSEELSGVRDVTFWLKNREKISNLPDLLRAIVIDIWLCNVDRNWGNLIGEPVSGEQIKLFFIDFEKSLTLRRHPLMSTSNVAARDLWPSGELGQLIRGWGYLQPPRDTIERIIGITATECEQLIGPLGITLDVDWVESTVETLMRRASQIRNLVGDVWNSR